MRNLFILVVLILMVGSLLTPCQVIAQVPEKMSYQAVIRDTEGNLVAGENVGMKISILQGSVDGTVVYTETRTPEANANGLVTFEIGGEGATAESGVFSAIDWSAGPYFIKTETEPSGGTSYTITGISQLLSVPFALYAKTAETISEPIVESDPVFSVSPASAIAENDISNWNEAYSWGNHADENYAAEDHDHDADYAPFSHDHSTATTDEPGFMNSTDKTKLDGIEAGANKNVNADWNATEGDAEILNKPATLSGYGITDALPISGGTVTGPISGSGENTTISGFNAAMVEVSSTAFTLTENNNGKIIKIENASDVTITVPTGLPAGFNCLVVQTGSGQALFAESGTSINNRNGFTKTAGQFAIATIVHLGNNFFITSGDMTH